MTAISTMTATTVIHGGTPNMAKAAVMPTNSVTSVSQSTIIRSSSENQPQKAPKPSKIASA